MAMGFPIILQVVGFQNSGKTTVITKLLQRLTQHNVKTGVLKHHGHENTIDFNDKGKDTESHRNAGAYITGVTAEKATILSMEHELTIEQSIQIYKILNMECLLIEGYKNVQYPRVVLIQESASDLELINSSAEPICFISEQEISVKSNAPFFLRKDEETWLDFLTSNIMCRLNEERRDNPS
jgi:molybdopterin-guanine dinucleotide biosynthesis protein B